VFFIKASLSKKFAAGPLNLDVPLLTWRGI